MFRVGLGKSTEEEDRTQEGFEDSQRPKDQQFPNSKFVLRQVV